MHPGYFAGCCFEVDKITFVINLYSCCFGLLKGNIQNPGNENFPVNPHLNLAICF